MKKKLTPEERQNRTAIIAFVGLILFIAACIALVMLFPIK